MISPRLLLLEQPKNMRVVSLLLYLACVAASNASDEENLDVIPKFIDPAEIESLPVKRKIICLANIPSSIYTIHESFNDILV